MAPKKKVVEKPQTAIKKKVAAPKKEMAIKAKATAAKSVIKAEPKTKTLVPKKELSTKPKPIPNRVVMQPRILTGEGWRRVVLRKKQAKRS